MIVSFYSSYSIGSAVFCVHVKNSMMQIDPKSFKAFTVWTSQSVTFSGTNMGHEWGFAQPFTARVT